MTTQGTVPSRLRLATETCLTGTLAAGIASTVQTLVWDQEERLRGTVEQFGWSPVDDLSSILVLMPFGFVFYTLFHPAGWLFWIGFGSVLWNRSRAFIVVAVAGAIWFGLGWPESFEMMMSV